MTNKPVDLYDWWKQIHDYIEEPSTPGGIPKDPPLLQGCTQEIWDQLECMDSKTVLRAIDLIAALSITNLTIGEPSNEPTR